MLFNEQRFQENLFSTIPWLHACTDATETMVKDAQVQVFLQCYRAFSCAIFTFDNTMKNK